MLSTAPPGGGPDVRGRGRAGAPAHRPAPRRRRGRGEGQGHRGVPARRVQGPARGGRALRPRDACPARSCSRTADGAVNPDFCRDRTPDFDFCAGVAYLFLKLIK